MTRRAQGAGRRTRARRAVALCTTTGRCEVRGARVHLGAARRLTCERCARALRHTPQCHVHGCGKRVQQWGARARDRTRSRQVKFRAVGRVRKQLPCKHSGTYGLWCCGARAANVGSPSLPPSLPSLAIKCNFKKWPYYYYWSSLRRILRPPRMSCHGCGVMP